MAPHLEHFDKRKTKYHGMVRALTVLCVFLAQIATVILLTGVMQRRFFYFYFTLEVLSIAAVYGLVNDERRSKQFWIIVLLLMPGYGFILYYLWGSNGTNSRLQKKVRIIEARMKTFLESHNDVCEEFGKIHPNKVQISRYLQREGFPIYKNTAMKYYAMGDDMVEDFANDLRSAEKFIFIEYFIIYKGEWWDSIQSILEEKAMEGVDVRIIVDDFGSLFLNVRELRKELNAKGVKIYKFAPVERRLINMAFNYRDHQKITVVDGRVAYTGGVNLADEYINKIERFGVWKDSAIRMEGDAVASITNTFLAMWQVASKDYIVEPGLFMKSEPANEENMGFVQPFWGGPHKNPNNPPEAIYNLMLSKARDYIYITTPYLVLDQKLVDNVTQAARSGVDVRIITPHIYDKWYVYMVNIANYGTLLKAGVRIYEFTPGFMHAKNMVADDECAVCGSTNMDCRSLYIHYENGVFISENDVVTQMRDDFLETLDQCEEITYENWINRPKLQQIVQWICKLTSPLL